MENQIATTEFTTTKGIAVKVTAALILSKTHYADGDNITVDCCEMGLINATLDGFPTQSGYHKFPKPVLNGSEYMLGAIGQLGLNAENLDKVEEIIKKLEQHPAWIAKQAKITKNRKEIAEMEAQRDANGYCRKCHSYCFGDCEAN